MYEGFSPDLETAPAYVNAKMPKKIAQITNPSRKM
jgi:hypothetical protein